MSRQEILDFQARWMRPAGIAAIVGAALLVAAVAINSVGSGDGAAEQLERYQDHAGRFTLASVISGLGLFLLSGCLYFVFRSALARGDRMRAFFGPLIVIGAVLVGVQGLMTSLGLKQASDQYIAGVPAVEAKARQEVAQAQQAQRKPPAKGSGAATTGTTATTATGTTARTTTTVAGPSSVEQRVTDAQDDFAEDEINDSSTVRTGQLIGLFGGLALIGGAIYTLVWAMRTGLLTRFMATLGIVLIAALVLIPTLGPIAIFWFAVLGLMLAGWWIRPLPPAWAAGEAIPWPRPGEDLGPLPEEGPAGTVEGSGRQVSEQPLPDNGAGAEQPRETPGQRRKKRKRRK